ncbi:hypothetical protein PORCRE_136 [Porphyromonas crevioricanis JCM 15906]|uniref:Uncharacterized protein n=1 Tax=Porphyromonas crevioricanis JCM 15906 TaxID=1305617 RepID=S4NFU3_9PORP|nr:hypothetical protein PORCRE_136 [Porphyromonas crevioricanis JCM 15906]GAD07038.1 hypothetical protein PORCAN_651 [Porphyromonas crevioricanis JCM 13913]
MFLDHWFLVFGFFCHRCAVSCVQIEESLGCADRDNGFAIQKADIYRDRIE